MTPAREHVLCVVQARMGSSRLPGKVLMDVDGRPLLRFMLDRIAPISSSVNAHIVVATSDEPIDDPIVASVTGAGFDVVRGPEADVLARFGVALDRHPADHVIRLTADCPLSDPQLIAEVVAEHRRSGADYTSNTLTRSFPDGLDVEVVRAEALRVAVIEARDPYEREHVTPFVYRRPDRFRLVEVIAPENLGDLRWTVDTADDLDLVRTLAQRSRSVTDWRAVLATYERLEQLERLER